MEFLSEASFKVLQTKIDMFRPLLKDEIDSIYTLHDMTTRFIFQSEHSIE